MYRSCQKHESLSLYDLPTGHHLFVVLFIASPNTDFCTALTTQSITKNDRIMSQARSTKPNIYLTEILRSAFTKKVGSSFANKTCQGQLQTTQSVSVTVP